MKTYGEGYQAGVDDFYHSLTQIAEEWYALKIVDDKQYIGLLQIMHELNIIYNYERKPNYEEI